MSNVFATPHPKSSKIWQHVQTGDFIDGYKVASDLSPRDASKLAFQMPKWAMALMRLRNIIVKPLGLKTDDVSSESALFPTTYEDDGELIIGTDDTHLNFRISVLQQGGHIHMATWVHRNNALGRAYLAIVKPFHVLIVRDGLKRVARASKV